jgi:cell wall-associated NlpC family hydrolase
MATLKAREDYWVHTTQSRRRTEQRRRTQAINARRRAVSSRGTSRADQDARLYEDALQRLQHTRQAVATGEHALETIRKQLDAQRDPGERALAAAGQWLGRHETGGNNRAPWLDAWARQYIGGWMVGQSWCGLLCVVAWAQAGVALPKDTVSTVAIYNRAHAGNGYRLIAPENARPGDLVVMDFDKSRGPVAMHVGLARGPMRGGMIPTREGNTSPTAGGSQNNGDGIYDKSRPASVVACVARPIAA